MMAEDLSMLPIVRLGKCTDRVPHGRWKLTIFQYTLSNRFHKGDMALEGKAGMLVGTQHPDRLAQFIAHNPDRFKQIRIVANDYGHVVKPQVAIMDHMGSDIDIRAFFFSFYYIHELFTIWQRLCTHHPHCALQKLSVDDVKIGDRGDGSQIGLLPNWLIKIIRPRAHLSGVILDPGDLVLRQ